MLFHDPFQRRTGGSVELLRHAAGEIGLASGENRVVHGFGHEHRIFGGGDTGIHEDGVGAEFHGERSVGGGAHSGVNDQQYGGDHLAQYADVGLVLNPHAA